MESRNSAVNMSNAVPDTGLDLGVKIGFTDLSSDFTLENSANSPEVLIRARSFHNMGRLILTGANPAPTPGDPISNGIVNQWVPALRSLMQLALRNEQDAVDMIDVCQYYAYVEELYAKLSTPALLNSIYEHFDWSSVRANSINIVPQGFQELALDWQVTPYQFDTFWKKYYDVLAQQLTLPNIPGFIDRVAAAFFMDDYDKCLRLDLIDFDMYADTGDIVSFVLRLETILTALNTDAMRAVQYYVENFLPYRAGLPEPAMLGVSPAHAISWWNQAMLGSYQSSIQVLDKGAPLAAYGVVCSNTCGESVIAGVYKYVTPGDPLLIDTYANDIALGEIMLTAMFNTYLKDVGGFDSVLVTYCMDRGLYILLGDGTVEYVDTEFFEEGEDVALGNNVNTYTYLNVLQSRFSIAVYDEATCTVPLSGSRHPIMTPTRVFYSQWSELATLVGPSMAGTRWINNLIAVMSGSAPRSISNSLIGPFTGR
jgi:hypothetical protein